MDDRASLLVTTGRLKVDRNIRLRPWRQVCLVELGLIGIMKREMQRGLMTWGRMKKEKNQQINQAVGKFVAVLKNQCRTGRGCFFVVTDGAPHYVVSRSLAKSGLPWGFLVIGVCLFLEEGIGEIRGKVDCEMWLEISPHFSHITHTQVQWLSRV